MLSLQSLGVEVLRFSDNILMAVLSIVGRCLRWLGEFPWCFKDRLSHLKICYLFKVWRVSYLSEKIIIAICTSIYDGQRTTLCIRNAVFIPVDLQCFGSFFLSHNICKVSSPCFVFGKDLQ